MHAVNLTNVYPPPPKKKKKIVVMKQIFFFYLLLESHEISLYTTLAM